MRLFDAVIARTEMVWSQSAYPNKFKNLTYTDEGETLSTTWLHAKSRPKPATGLEHEMLRLGYKNQGAHEEALGDTMIQRVTSKNMSKPFNSVTNT